MQPTKEQYELDTFGRSHDIMSNFWNSCFDDVMSTALKREKERSDSKSKFQVTRTSRPDSSRNVWLKHDLKFNGMFRCVCVSATTGSGGGPVHEASERRERPAPQLAEAELQPAGGGVAALESPAQTLDL